MKNPETQKQLKEHPSFEDVAVNLSDIEAQQFIKKYIGFCEELRMKPRWYATNSFNLKFKGKVICRFSMHDQLDLYLTVEPSRAKLENAIESMTPELRNFYFDNMRRCKQCNPKHQSTSIILFGITYDKLCGIGEMFLRNPHKELLSFIQDFTIWRKMYIQNCDS